MALIGGGDAISAVEVKALPSMDEIIPSNPDAKWDFNRLPEAVVEVFRSSLMAKCLAEFKAKYDILNQVEHVPTNEDEVHTHPPWYCALFTYPFTIGYSFPHLSLVEEFFHFYRVCPAQLAPFVYKVIKIL